MTRVLWGTPFQRAVPVYFAIALAAFVAWGIGPIRSFPGKVGTDAYAFWSYSVFLHSHPAAQIYDPAILGSHQLAHDGYRRVLPMLYPPPSLLLFWPFRLVGLPTFAAAWMALTFAGFSAALVSGRPYKFRIMLLLLVAPASVRCWIYGQTGFLIAALIIGGLRLCQARRPVAGGLVLGLLAIKPQLALLVPVALLATSDYRALGAAALSALVLCIASTALFGWETWPAFLHAVSVFQATSDNLMPTVAANLRLLGLPAWMAAVAQWLSAVIAGAWVWRSRSIPTLLAASFLATPYARIGDTPMLLGAVVLASETASAIRAVLYFLPYVMGIVVPMAFSVLPVGLFAVLAAARPGASGPGVRARAISPPLWPRRAWPTPHQ